MRGPKVKQKQALVHTDIDVWQTVLSMSEGLDWKPSIRKKKVLSVGESVLKNTLCIPVKMQDATIILETSLADS